MDRRYGSGTKCKTLSDTDAAYIAGIIDGEGCIGLQFQKPDSKRPGGAFMLFVAITMADADVLVWLARMTSVGLVGGPYQLSKRPNAATSFQWRARSIGAVSLIMQIRPYLKLKRRNADLLMAVHRELYLASAMSADPVWRERVKAAFHSLNQRGPARREFLEQLDLSKVFPEMWFPAD